MVQGNVVTSYGKGVDTDKPYDDQGKTNYIAQGDFGLTYQAITSRTQAGSTSTSTSTYTVRDGDTLGTIARNAWGDASLWWKIAIANGLAAAGPDEAMPPGQTINLPGQVGGLHNNADTYKPYDPGDVVGDTTPNMPAPPPTDQGGGCGLIGKIIMVVVAVVVTAFTSGAATAAMGGSLFGSTTAASVAAGAAGAATGWACKATSTTTGTALPSFSKTKGRWLPWLIWH